jgi:tRNA threonylcarbamoyladenosine biosynthesis protein TsaE
VFKELLSSFYCYELTLPDPEATAALGRLLAGVLKPGMLLTLEGPLGSGKTALTQAILAALGVEGRVKSPTYTLVEPYELPGLSVCHFDFYRFNSELDADDAGFREHFNAHTLAIVEWPDRAARWLPTPTLHVAWLPAVEGRRVRVSLDPGHAWPVAFLRSLQG